MPETNIPGFYNVNAYNPANPVHNQPHFPPPPDSELYDSPPAKPTAPQAAAATAATAATTTPHNTKPPATGAATQGAPVTHEKVGWADRLSALGAKAAQPINALANKLGSEAFLPSTMDKECEKAARILRGFCSTLPTLPYDRSSTHSDRC